MEYGQHNIISAGIWFAQLTGIPCEFGVARSVKIPEGAYGGLISSGGGGAIADITEVWCSNEDLSGNRYTNDNKP